MQTRSLLCTVRDDASLDASLLDLAGANSPAAHSCVLLQLFPLKMILLKLIPLQLSQTPMPKKTSLNLSQIPLPNVAALHGAERCVARRFPP